jgi:threonine dehydratase
MAGCQLFLKAEDRQRVSSFKISGAANKIARLDSSQRAKGVVAASAGNNAQGIALAARNLDSPCTIVMPVAASVPKIEAPRGYGATVALQSEDYQQAQEHAQQIMRDQSLNFIHAFDDLGIIAGEETGSTRKRCVSACGKQGIR